MSIGFVKVTTAIFTFLGGVGALLNALDISAEAVGFVVASILTLITAVLTLTGALALLKTAVIQAALRPLHLFFTNLLLATGASYALAAALATLLSIVTLGAFAVASLAILDFGSSALSAKSDVDKLNDSMRDFNRLSSGMGGSIGGSVDSSSNGPDGIRNNGGGGMNFTYNDYGGDSNPYAVGRYVTWREPRTTGNGA
jgi:heme/copper-type cytochrome/quinol oxidase subunit 4